MILILARFIWICQPSRARLICMNRTKKRFLNHSLRESGNSGVPLLMARVVSNIALGVYLMNDSYFGAVHADWTCTGELANPYVKCASMSCIYLRNSTHELQVLEKVVFKHVCPFYFTILGMFLLMSQRSLLTNLPPINTNRILFYNVI